ncbi:MAG TPA: nucleotidyltransferase domain-containing protein [Actinomycetota bacterium]|nr:nucleotidyltransferase domain-containing protein [Actinomycetota bacterium]
MPESVLERLRRTALGVFEGTAVVFAYLFGSHATGRARPDSDVDVAVYLDHEPDPDEALRISFDLANRLEAACRLGPVEVVVMNGAPLPLLGRILRERAVLWSRDEPTRVEFESLTFREFQGFDFHARELTRARLRDIAEGRR